MNKTGETDLNESTGFDDKNTTTNSGSDPTNNQSNSNLIPEGSIPSSGLSDGLNQNSSDNHSNSGKETTSDEPFVSKDDHLYENHTKPKLTRNYFCFDCGAIMTTLEDKNQHDLIEKERRNKNNDSDHSV